MKKLLFTLSLFLGLSLFEDTSAAAKGKPMFSIFNWNILGPNTQDADSFFPGKKSDYSRLQNILNDIPNYKGREAFMPSVLSFQEVDQTSRGILSSALSAKGYEEVGYQPKGANGGTVLYVKKADFKVVKSSGIDLGDGGSASLALLESTKTKAKIFVSSVHVSRTSYLSGQQSGERQLTVLQKATDAMLVGQDSSKVHKIFAGDYNTDAPEVTTSTLSFLSTKDSDKKTYTEAFPQAETSNDSSGSRKGIDHIVTSTKLVKVNQFSKIIGNEIGKKIHEQVASDHAALYAVYEDPQTDAITLSAKNDDLSAQDDSRTNYASSILNDYKNPNYFTGRDSRELDFLLSEITDAAKQNPAFLKKNIAKITAAKETIEAVRNQVAVKEAEEKAANDKAFIESMSKKAANEKASAEALAEALKAERPTIDQMRTILDSGKTIRPSVILDAYDDYLKLPEFDRTNFFTNFNSIQRALLFKSLNPASENNKTFWEGEKNRILAARKSLNLANKLHEIKKNRFLQQSKSAELFEDEELAKLESENTLDVIVPSYREKSEATFLLRREMKESNPNSTIDLYSDELTKNEEFQKNIRRRVYEKRRRSIEEHKENILREREKADEIAEKEHTGRSDYAQAYRELAL